MLYMRKPGMTMVRTTPLSLFILVVLVIFFYFLGVRLGQLEFVQILFEKVTLSLGVRSLSVLLLKVGCSSFIVSAMGFAVRAILATEAAPYVGRMVLPEGTAEASSSELTLQEAVFKEREALNITLIDGLSRYLETFNKEIEQEFPGTAVEVTTPAFFEKLRKSLVNDYGFESPPPTSLTHLKNFHDVIRRDLSFLDEASPYFRNNVFFHNLRDVLLRGKG
jgi:hypothetical protein